MNENHLLFSAAGVIIAIFGIIVYFAVQANIDAEIQFNPKNPKLPGFTQIKQLRDELKEQVQNTEVIDNLDGFISNSSDSLKVKIDEDSANLNNTLSTNSTDSDK